MNREHTGMDFRDAGGVGTATAVDMGKVRPIKTGRFHRTDTGNGERFAALHGGDVRHVATWKKDLVWDGRRWALDQTREVERKAKATVRAMLAEASEIKGDREREELTKWALGSESMKRRTAMLEAMRSEPGIAITHEQLDQDPWLLTVLNGTLDLRTGTLREHRREDMITKLVPIEYDADAACPTWERFLREVTCDRPELIEFLRRAIGYTLTGDVREHALFFLHGGGSNGKSTLMEILRELSGEHGGRAAPNLLMASRGDRHPTEAADLFGARLAFCNEVEEGHAMAEGMVKDLTGGDRVKARRMREDFWEFVPTHKLWLCGNHKPMIRGTDDGIWRRVKLIPFDAQWKDAADAEPGDKIKDPDLLNKLRAELPGILAWAVRGCVTWQKGGLTTPEVVKAATAEYREEQDTLGQFLSECCVIDPGGEVRASVLYHCFTEWCELHGERQRWTQTAFGKELQRRPGIGRRRVNGSRYTGILLASNDNARDVAGAVGRLF